MILAGGQKMGARDRTNFELTLKGTEELAQRTYRLDAKTRNILFIIQRGYPTIQGILENSIFPREEIIERLRNLLRGHFLTVHVVEDPQAMPTTLGPEVPTESAATTPAPDAETEQPEEPIYFGL
jgi:hypothetical protein